jgi:hypothetical protein
LHGIVRTLIRAVDGRRPGAIVVPSMHPGRHIAESKSGMDPSVIAVEFENFLEKTPGLVKLVPTGERRRRRRQSTDDHD